MIDILFFSDDQYGNLIEDDLIDIVNSPQFKSFRRRNQNPEYIQGCAGCEKIHFCKGGCAARSYLYNLHQNGERSLFSIDPYCPKEINPQESFPQNPKLPEDLVLVHKDYLCTWIGKPKNINKKI